MFCPYQKTEDGIEMQFATNHLGSDSAHVHIKVINKCSYSYWQYILIIYPFFYFHFSGHFLLTNLLLDKMKQTAKDTGIEGRIINLSSIAHAYTYEEGIRFNSINDEEGQERYIYYILFSLQIFFFINNVSCIHGNSLGPNHVITLQLIFF